MSVSIDQVPTIALRGDAEIPQLGFGVFQVPPEETAEAVTRALEAGYRHIDTAAAYGNEAEVGQAVHASGLDRERRLRHDQVLQRPTTATSEARHAFKESLERLGLDYVDLYLIHWPVPVAGPLRRDVEGVHRAAGRGPRRARSASRTSSPTHLRRIIEETGVTPAVNQVELHPHLQQAGLRARARRARHRHRGLEPARRRAQVLDDPAIARDRRGARQDARPRSCCAGTSSSATS